MTGRERALLEDAYCALEAGDVDHVADLLRVVLDDVPARPDRNRCASCGRWPGERSNCACGRNVAEAA